MATLSLAKVDLKHHEAQSAFNNHADAVAVSSDIREHWMREAIQALYTLTSPCPFAAFGTVIVNHTSGSSLGDLVCIGANDAHSTGNPTLHGEIAGINNCTQVLTDPEGQYRLSPSEGLEAYKDLTLYTTAEPCPMCASAIRWAGFKECVFATSIPTLMEQGWHQISMLSQELFEHSLTLGTRTSLLGGVLSNATDPLFAWQFNPNGACPAGCERDGSENACVPIQEASPHSQEL